MQPALTRWVQASDLSCSALGLPALAAQSRAENVVQHYFPTRLRYSSSSICLCSRYGPVQMYETRFSSYRRFLSYQPDPFFTLMTTDNIYPNIIHSQPSATGSTPSHRPRWNKPKPLSRIQPRRLLASRPRFRHGYLTFHTGTCPI